MFTAITVGTSIYLKCLTIIILLSAFCADMPQFPSIMTDVIMFILKDLVQLAILFHHRFNPP